MLKKSLLVLVALVLVLVAVIASRPSSYRVERSIEIAAEPALIYGIVSDFNRFNEWSPWGKRDPNLNVTVEGEPGSVGMSYAWNGNSDVGSGRMTFTAVQANASLDVALEFVEPFASVAKTSFAMAPSADGTRFTWSMTGENNFVSKAFSLFMDMDAMIGADFENGLAALKTVVEADARRAAEEAAAAAAAQAELDEAAQDDEAELAEELEPVVELE